MGLSAEQRRRSSGTAASRMLRTLEAAEDMSRELRGESRHLAASLRPPRDEESFRTIVGPQPVVTRPVEDPELSIRLPPRGTGSFVRQRRLGGHFLYL